MVDFTAFEESMEQLERWLCETEVLVRETEAFLQELRREREARREVAA